jgi:hypothetical protein
MLALTVRIAGSVFAHNRSLMRGCSRVALSTKDRINRVANLDHSKLVGRQVKSSASDHTTLQFTSTTARVIHGRAAGSSTIWTRRRHVLLQSSPARMLRKRSAPEVFRPQCSRPRLPEARPSSTAGESWIKLTFFDCRGRIAQDTMLALTDPAHISSSRRQRLTM